MFRSTRSFHALLMAGALSMATTACAGQRVYGNNYPRDNRQQIERQAYDNGYRRGFQHGQDDARDRRSFRIERDSDYRNADRYRGYGDDYYRRVFQDAYRTGYTEGYDRVARYDRRGTYPDYRTSPNGPVYGNQGRIIGTAATQNGYRDGYEQGRDDARDRDNYDPRGAKRYREGDHDYDNRYGSRDQYKQEYRAAFQQGYDQGYRENRR